MIRRLLQLSALLLIMSGYSNPTGELEASALPKQEKPATPVKNLNSQEAKYLLAQKSKIIILDVRTAPEYAGGHLQAATNMDYTAPGFAARVSKLDKNKPYLIYCAVGGRSSKATKLMQEMGFKHLYNAAEGFTSLKKSGVPVAE